MQFGIAHVVEVLEIGLALFGLVVLWRVALSPAARARPRDTRIAPWNLPVSEFFFFVLSVLAGSFLLAGLASAGAKPLGLRGDAATVLSGAAAQLGMLAGALIYWSKPERGPPTAPPEAPNSFVSGAATFVICLPLLLITAALWELVLKACGLPVERQDLITMFANAESPWLLAIMIALAIVIAPLTEELVFRAGLYRFLRTRIPRWIALTAPALVFASLHVNWKTLQGLTSLAPLTVLAILFSLAYERTGRIGTSIVAHALFNLNTVILIFSGVGL